MNEPGLKESAVYNFVKAALVAETNSNSKYVFLIVNVKSPKSLVGHTKSTKSRVNKYLFLNCKQITRVHHHHYQ